MELREVMTTDVLEVELATTLQEACQAMRDRKASSVTVSEDGYLVGILTERDIVKAVAEGIDTTISHVRDYMTRSPVAATPDMSVEEAVQIMIEHGFRHLPVVDGERELKGIVSIRDLARAGIKLPADAIHK
jgi:CBS domain-containing protein